jgi:hypothetical protein
MEKGTATGMERLQMGSELVKPTPDEQGAPPMELRDWYALHAPPPPGWWKVRTPLDLARWSWTYADSMIRTRLELTTPETAQTPGVNRP